MSWLLLSWLQGCVPTVYSENFLLQLQADDVSTLGAGNVSADMLAGTTTCAAVGWTPGFLPPPAPTPLQCFDLEPQGVISVQNGCFQFAEPGLGELAFLPNGSCPPPEEHFRFTVLHPDRVKARPIDFDTLAANALFEAPLGPPPSQPDGEPWKIVSGGYFTFFPRLYRTVDSAEVGFELARAEPAVKAPQGGLLWALEADHVTIEAERGAQGQLSFEYDHPEFGASFPFADVVGVDRFDAVELEIVPVYTLEGSFREPAAARAVLRDAGGDLLWGAPVLWTLDEGNLALGALDWIRPGPDYVLMADACLPPPQAQVERQATLRATVGSLTSTVELRWSVPASPYAYWAPHRECVGPSEPPPLTWPPEPEPDSGTLPDPDLPGPVPPASDWEAARWTGGACLCSAQASSSLPASAALPVWVVALWLGFSRAGAGRARAKQRARTGRIPRSLEA